MSTHTNNTNINLEETPGLHLIYGQARIDYEGGASFTYARGESRGQAATHLSRAHAQWRWRRQSSVRRVTGCVAKGATKRRSNEGHIFAMVKVGLTRKESFVLKIGERKNNVDKCLQTQEKK